MRVLVQPSRNHQGPITIRSWLAALAPTLRDFKRGGSVWARHHSTHSCRDTTLSDLREDRPSFHTSTAVRAVYGTTPAFFLGMQSDLAKSGAYLCVKWRRIQENPPKVETLTNSSHEIEHVWICIPAHRYLEPVHKRFGPKGVFAHPFHHLSLESLQLGALRKQLRRLGKRTRGPMFGHETKIRRRW